MTIPTHIVIDTRDGWTWARDRNGLPFTDTTATEWANTLNDERVSVNRAFGAPEERPCIVASVNPVMSPELMAALAKDRGNGLPAITAPPDRFRCHGCNAVVTDPEYVTAHKLLHGLVTNIGPGE